MYVCATPAVGVAISMFWKMEMSDIGGPFHRVGKFRFEFLQRLDDEAYGETVDIYFNLE